MPELKNKYLQMLEDGVDAKVVILKMSEEIATLNESRKFLIDQINDSTDLGLAQIVNCASENGRV